MRNVINNVLRFKVLKYNITVNISDISDGLYIYYYNRYLYICMNTKMLLSSAFSIFYRFNLNFFKNIIIG